jgi:glycosyltransferase involved in cell wall biosynthesis
MKIAYIANARMPTEKAHGLQIMHMCRAFTQQGHEVILVVPSRKNWIEKSIWEFYGVPPTFKVAYVPIVDFIVWDRWLGNFALWLETISFGLRARRVVEELEPDVAYSREPFASAWVPKWIPQIFEAHTFPNRMLWLYRFIWKKYDRVVTVTDGLKRMFAEQGIPESKLRTAADAVDYEFFQVAESKRGLRDALKLPQDKFLAVYAGHLYPYKGIPDLIDACRDLTLSIKVVIVGGRPTDLERTKKLISERGLSNVIVTGHVAHHEVPKYLAAADMAVMPYTRESHHVEYYSSPLKLFEYLAAGRAILSTDLPSVREVLDDRTAEFVPPEDPKAIAVGINRLAGDPARLAELEKSSRELAKRYTWRNRADAVLAAMPKPRLEWKSTFWKRYALEIRLALLALVIRLAYVIFVPQYAIEGGDGVYYLHLADRARGIDPHLEYGPYFQPAYPYLLAAIRALFGDAVVWIRIAQATLSAATVFTAMMIARRWGSAYASWIVGLIGALYAPMIMESGILYTETMFTFMLTISAWAFLHMLETPRLKGSLLAGLAFAGAVLTREIAAYYAIIVAGYAGLKTKKTALTLGFLLPLAVVVAGLAWRNAGLAYLRKADDYVPLVSKGFEQQLQAPDFQRLATDPARFYLYPVGAFKFFALPFRLVDLSDGVSVRQTLMLGHWPEIRNVLPQLFAKGMLIFVHWLIILAAIYGLAKGKLTREAKIFIVLVISMSAAAIVIRCVGHVHVFARFEPLARYRFPVEPLILILAAVGLEKLTRKT